MKKYSILLLIIALLLYNPGNGQSATRSASQKKSTTKKSTRPNNSRSTQQTGSAAPEIRWTGTISVVETYTGLIGISERHTNLSFQNALPTLYRNIETTDFNFTDDKGTGSVKEHTETILTSKDEKTGAETKRVIGKCDCNGDDKSELHAVVIDRSNKTYDIHAVPPMCKGGDGGDGSCGGASWDVIISEKELGSNNFLLSGSETRTRDITIGTVTTTTTWNLKGCPPWSDPQTRLRKINAQVKAAAERFIKRTHDELCIKLKVASGLRTNHEQDSLYAIGRPPPPSKRVTNAEGGDSYHNYGLAIDVYIVKDNGDLDFDTIIPEEAIKIAKEEGFLWGGDWEKFKDNPHFEMTSGKTIKQLKAGR